MEAAGAIGGDAHRVALAVEEPSQAHVAAGTVVTRLYAERRRIGRLEIGGGGAEAHARHECVAAIEGGGEPRVPPEVVGMIAPICPCDRDDASIVDGDRRVD